VFTVLLPCIEACVCAFDNLRGWAHLCQLHIFLKNCTGMGNLWADYGQFVNTRVIWSAEITNCVDIPMFHFFTMFTCREFWHNTAEWMVAVHRWEHCILFVKKVLWQFYAQIPVRPGQLDQANFDSLCFFCLTGLGSVCVTQGQIHENNLVFSVYSLFLWLKSVASNAVSTL